MGSLRGGGRVEREGLMGSLFFWPEISTRAAFSGLSRSVFCELLLLLLSGLLLLLLWVDA